MTGIPHLPNRHDHRIRNFGFGSRDMRLAAMNLLLLACHSYSTRAHLLQRFNLFLLWLSVSYPELADLRAIERDMVEQYAMYLGEKVQNDSLAASTAQNYLSAVNRILSYARHDGQLRVRPVKDGKLPKRARNPPQLNLDVILESRKRVSDIPLLDALTGLQHHIGLRPGESIKIDAVAAYQQALDSGEIIIEHGTKGGRKRIVHITKSDQIEALLAASTLQQQMKHYSLCPPSLTYAKFRRQCYRLKHIKGMSISFKDFRHWFARNHYQTHTGFLPPASLGKSKRQHRLAISEQFGLSIDTVRQKDQQARLIVAEELGHGRPDVVSAYCG